MKPAAQTAVVYIAYGPYGTEPFARFAASYRRFAAGAAHDLIIAWKGVPSAKRPMLQDLLDGIPHVGVQVPDRGFDLGTYRHVATVTDYARYCFLNTNSELRAPDWLAKLETAIDEDDVLAAGATASYQSLAADMLRMVGMRRSWRALAIAKRRLIHLRLRRRYPPFPNPHLRTNAFLIGRPDFLALRMPVLRTKQDASLFESGREGMTRQLCSKGGEVMLVDAGGQALAVDRWPGSNTFWQGEQHALLVADNQTRRYAETGRAERETLFRYAWTPLDQ